MEIEVLVLDQAHPVVAAKVLSVQQSAHRVEADLIEFDAIPPLHETVDDVLNLDLTVLGAMEGADLVGIVGYRRLGDVVDIDRLAVLPSRFRRGVAGLIVAEVHRREIDARSFEVSTGARNQPAIESYTKLGYRRLADKSLSANLKIARFVNP
jgi:GNAT superfamily N-acetyltransferase